MHISLACCTLLALTLLAAPAKAADQSVVFISNGQLTYFGPITQEANQKLAALDKAAGGEATVLAIRSGGGDTSAGIALGAWVKIRKLDVKVLEMCFSACANYVFPAGNRKIVSSFAVVGYHGGLGSASFMTNTDPASQKILDAMSSAERESHDAEEKRFFAEKLAEETEFFRSIGVRPEITLLGQAAPYVAKYEKIDKMIGWTYSIADFAKLGVDKINVINGPWVPRILSGKYMVYRVKVKD